MSMEVTPDKFLWLFLVVATLGWILFNFTAKLLAWIASTVLRAKVQFRLAGFQRLKDVTINFQKGAVAHLAIGEVRFSVRKQLKAFFGDYKFQLFLSDVEVVLQKPPTTTSKKAKAKIKVSTHRNSASERRKWLIVATLAKYLKFSITELVFKVLEIPNMSLEIKELDLDLLKEDVGSTLLGLKLSVIPCTIYLGELENWVYNSGITKFGQRLLSVTRASSAPVIDTAPSVLFLMEHLSVACSFDHDREAGVMMQQLEVACGDAMLDLNEELLVSENDPLGASTKPVQNIETAEKQKDEVTVVPMVNPPSSSLEKEEDGVAVDVPPGRVVKVPEKLGFTLPSLTVKCTQEGGQMMENKVKGILLRGGRSRLSEQAGDLISQLDIHMDCGEILIMCENKQSVLEILKVAVAASLEFPTETRRPLQAQIDVKLGGTQCNLLTASLDCWLKFALRVMKKKNSNLRHEHHPATEARSSSMPTPPKRTKSSTKRKISWGCTLSAPDMLLTAYSLDGMALYNVSSQTSHLFINTGSGKEMALHAELGECVISMAEEADSSSEDPLAGGESIAGCLMRVSRVVVEWGLADSDLVDVTVSEKKSKTLVAEFSGSKLYFSFPRLQSILSTAMVMEKYLKTLSNERKSKKTNSMRLKPTQKKAGGIKQAILRLEGFSVQLMGLLHAEDEKVPDPKKVNFGNQGGESVVTKSSDGSLRTAMIHVTKGNRLRSKYNAIAELAHLNLCFDKDVHGFTVEVERGSLVYQELSPRDKVLGDITAFRVQNLEVIYQPAVVGGEKGNLALVSATGVMTRWEPDLHLLCHEVGLQTKGLLDFRKSLLRKERNSPLIAAAMKVVETKETSGQNSSKVTVALDVEGFDFIAEVADGVELVLHVDSLFSEDAEIGLLLENSLLTLNSATVLSSESLQISRIPVADEQHKDGPLRLVAGLGDFKRWDCIIQGSGTRIIMPYRMPFRAMEDACEDMWRTLKLVMVAQKSRSGAKAAAPTAAVVTKARTKRSSEMRALKFVMRDVVAEIEEEPLQGWFDEHHRLMAEEVCELIFREQLFNDKVAKECCKSRTHVSNSDGEAAAGSQSGSSQKQHTETGLQNPSTVKKEHERLQRQTFNAYHGACKKLVPYMGSGAKACSGLQAGFKPSITRRSLASITAASLEVVLTKVEGGREGMIEIIRKLDCVSPDLQVPFSRVMGRTLQVQGSSLAVCLRDYSAPLLAAESGSCDGVVVLAQQATVFPPQIPQDVYLGRWRRITVNRSISGSTPPLKCYLQIPVELDTAKVSYGVGHEPAIADVSYAFSIALRKMDISVHRDQWPEKIPLPPLPVKKERNLPWWDDMRYYIHGNNSVNVTNFEWSFLATTNPYEEANMMRLVSNSMEIKQSEGCVVFNGKEFGLHISSLEIVPKGLDSGVYNLKLPVFLTMPVFELEITMDWDCESGAPLNHYLHAFPREMKLREKVYDPFRSTSFSLVLNFGFKANEEEVLNEDLPAAAAATPGDQKTSRSFTTTATTTTAQALKGPTRWISHGSASPASHEECVGTIPTMNLGAHDLMWIFKWWSLYYLPPHKLRSFARFPRFGVPRVPRSGNLSLDKVLTEFMLRVDSTPACIYHSSLMEDDPAIGLAFHMKKLKYELCYSRGLGHFTIETKRDPLELVYQGLDIHSMKVELHRDQSTPPADDDIAENLQKSDKVKQLLGLPEVNSSELAPDPFRSSERGFLLTTDRLTIRKQAPKADSARLSLWLEGSRRQLRVETAIRNMDIDYGSGSDVLSDDDGFNVVLADNCLRVSLYGLKLLWTLENRDAVWAWVGDMAQAFEHPKPSPSRQFAQRKRMEEQQKVMAVANKGEKGKLNSGGYSTQLHKGGSISAPSSPSRPSKLHTSTPGRGGANSLHSPSTALPKEALSEEEGEGTMHFMVNVVQPQFNLHSEEAHGRLLLAAASGQVLACSYHSLVSVGFDMIVQALGSVSTQGALQEIAWKRRELSVLLKHVQAHIAPTDVDPGAGLQWLPRILTGTAKVKRTGTLLERIFMPCTMYFQYTRHKGGTTNFEVKPLKELSFNSPNITATMTSRQFQIVVDVMSNLLLARLPKSRKNKLYEEEGEEEVDEVVPEGVEEVELARIKVEQAQRECRLLFRDLRMLRCSDCGTRDVGTVWSPKAEEETLWMISSARSILAQKLEVEFMVKSKARKAARLGLRVALQHAAQQQLALKEKNKSPSSAMRISWAFDKLVWSMICDGESFAEAEINNMILMVDRDFKDIGVARFTIKSFVVKNCLPGAKLDTVLSAWNPPAEWGRNTMLRVEARQGAPKDGFSPMERFQVDIYPLRIFLTEAMYTKLWKYFFPDEEQDVKRQEVWKGSTVAKRGGRRGTSTVLMEQRSSLEASVITSSRTSIITSGLAVPPHVLPGVPVEVLPRVDFMMAAQALEVAKLQQQQQQRKTGMTASMNEQCKSSSSLERVEEPDIDLVSEEALTKTFRQGVSVRTSLPITSRQDALPTTSAAVSTASTSTENGGSLKSKDRKVSKSSKASLQEEKKDSKMKKSFLEFHNIKICQVELLVTYEGSPIAVSDLRLLMDTLVLLQFTGSWRRLFSKVKKHIIWSVLKSVTGMQGKKFKDKLHPESDSNSSDSAGSYGVAVEQFPTAHQRQSDRAGEGFVSSIRGLFNSQRRKARALVLRTMRGQEGLDDLQISSSEDEAGISKSPRGAKRIPRRTRKARPAHRDRGSLADRGLRGTQEASQSQSETELSEGSSMYEDFD